jgi:WD40 repeat protein/serine/threonine protein kinase
LLRDIFSEAAEITDPVARGAFLDSACKGDDTLRAKVERLLKAESSAGKFLRDPSDTTAGLSPTKLGERIGRYRLIEPIGRGGCGVVYLAEQEEPVRRRVALKVIKLGMDTQSVVARFEAERQALAMMEHPNIARVLDAGATEKGRPFFVMELVSGLKITDYCDRHELSIRQRLELFIPICHAVQHAHQKGIIHRDLKPSNILVTQHEGVAVPKVIDFGIAKATEQDLDDRSKLTGENQFLGTPAYMSPEQVGYGGHDIDTRADIYSLGVILYELLAGQPPFDPRELAQAGVEEMRRIIREVDPPRPSTTMIKGVSPRRLPSLRKPSRERLTAVRGDLDWIVTKCLEKDRARRYATANDLALDIRRHLDHESVLARPPTQFYRLQKVLRRHRLGFTAAGVIALVLVAAVILSSQLALRATRAEHEQSRLRGVAETKANESRLRLIRRYVAEGNRLLEQRQAVTALPWMVEALQLELGDRQREKDERLRIAQTLAGAPQLLLNFVQGKSVNSVALSPDGTRIASGSDDGVVRITDIAGGGDISTNLVLPGEVGRVAFSPDGTRVVGVSIAGIARIWNSATGEALTALLQPDEPASTPDSDSHWLKPAASFSADGKLLLLACRSRSAQLRDANSGKLLRELRHREVVYHAAFSRDGVWAVTASKDGSARVWDVATGTPAGPPLEHSGSVVFAQFSSDANKLLTVRDRHVVQLWDWREGRRIAPEIPRRSDLYHASLSPDGSNILTTAWSGFAHFYDATTSRLMVQFQQQGGLIDAAYSPDGRNVATACEDGNAWLWEVEDVTGHPVVLPQGNHLEEIAFNGNGRMLAAGGRGGRVRVWDVAPPERGVRLPGNDVQWVEFDASGRRALILSTGSRNGLRVYDVPTGGLISSVALKNNEVRQARFSPDGRRIAGFGSADVVLLFDADSGQRLRRLQHRRNVRDAVWSPDGKLIYTHTGLGGVHGWQAATGTVVLTITNATAVRAMALSPNGEQLAIGYDNNTVQVRNSSTGQSTGNVLTTKGRIREVRLSSDAKLLAVACDTPTGESSVDIRHVATGQLIGKPLVHRGKVASVEFSGDGHWLATACDDHTARVWDARTSEPVSPWLRHDFEVEEVCFSPDGSRLATRARRGAVRLWSASTGEPITGPIEYQRNRGDGWVSYSPDGERLLLSRGGNEAWLRELQPDSASVEELRLLAQVTSCTRFDPAAGMVPLDETELTAAWNKLRTIRSNKP